MQGNKKYGVGIVGCGAISDVHAQALKQIDQAELISVYSRNVENARRLGEKYEVSWFNTWNMFIQDDRVDVVSICTPSGTHLDYGKLAADAGKHVIVEKPIEVTLERGQQLIQVCQKNGVKLAVIFQNRFMTPVIELKRKIDSGEIGKVFQGDAYIKWYRDQAYYDSGAWRGTLALDGGGALINQSIHTIDLLQWIMGDVSLVFGQIDTFTHERIEGEDAAVAVLRFKSGAIGVIEGSTSIYPAQERRLEIHGNRGTAILDGDKLQVSTVNSPSRDESSAGNEQGGAAGATSPFSGFSIEPHRRQMEAIFEAISKNQDPPISGPEALKSLAIVLAIYESSKSNSAINLQEFLRAKTE